VDQLFAPWRRAWVTSPEARGSSPAEAGVPGESGESGEAAGCLFCRVFADPSADAGNLVVLRGRGAFVMLNRYPYNGGHLLVAPVAHRGALEALDAAARSELLELAARALAALGKLYNPDGYNLGINQGRAAGAGIPDHVHLHVVPRWSGDTNFMTAVGATRVISEDLGAVRAALAAQLSGDSGDSGHSGHSGPSGPSGTDGR
jgi:ATP adenylyltransferase